MKNLFDPVAVAEVKGRLATLTPQTNRLWGKMTVGQMVAHCVVAFQTATGDSKPSRMLIGRLIGGMVKRMAIGNDDPMKKNSPTAPSFIMRDARNLDVERSKLIALIDGFAAGGRAACTAHPHTFFGPMTPDEWATLMYKHVDHHLRQFGV